MLNSEYERREMHNAKSLKWVVLTIVLAFPVLVYAQNDDDLQDNPSPRAQSQCQLDGTCAPADNLSSINSDDTQTVPNQTTPNVNQSNRLPPESSAQNPANTVYSRGVRQPETPSAQVPRTPKKAPEPTDFQDLVSLSVGKMLPIYGESLFENVPTTFAPARSTSR